MKTQIISTLILLISTTLLSQQNSLELNPLPSSIEYAAQTIQKPQLIEKIKYLSSDQLKGRKTGTAENKKARNYIVDFFIEKDLDVTLQPFQFERDNKTHKAVNIITIIEGTENPENFIAVTAHFDHVGIDKSVERDSIYNGADDNASGTSALLLMAKYFKLNPPKNSFIFIALDAEEMGLQGAKYFVESNKRNIVLNINMDMISRNKNNEIYICGTRFTPSLKSYFEAIPVESIPIKVSLGHDGLDGKDSWVNSSDHAPFHKSGIPFLYFGVEDHPDYHKPTDEFSRIDPDFYFNVVNFITHTLADIDSKIGY
ncbi:M28 family peptidase [uncultured Planktosalinus sp.]|uniref:M28 family peptidase n=1 Tax=uncultured Planktosalinus sp. TaxID=1810935 RepID=UPI0030DDC95A